MKGKIIVIEGTDCSGKETQARLLVNRLKKEGIKVEMLSFPMYDTPTGKIVGGPFLGKKYIQESIFPEGAANVEAKVASLYYAADRRYHLSQINELLESGTNLILDRYVESNMAHQGGKLVSSAERKDLYEWIDTLEFKMLELPRPDKVLLLYLPYGCGKKLRENRPETLDQVESVEEHLRNAEKTYLELAELYHFDIISCSEDEEILPIETIHEKVYEYTKKIIS